MYFQNQKYYKALKNVIDKRHARGEKANVLDIGTGTGLLAMMAAKCNADSVIACEVNIIISTTTTQCSFSCSQSHSSYFI